MVVYVPQYERFKTTMKPRKSKRESKGYKCTCDRCRSNKLHKHRKQIDPEERLRDFKNMACQKDI